MPVPVAIPAFFVAFFTKYATLITVLVSLAFFRIVIRVFTLLGVGITTFFGFDVLGALITAAVRSQLEGLPNHVLQLILIARVDDAMTILISGYLTSVSLRFVNGVTRPAFVNVGNGGL